MPLDFHLPFFTCVSSEMATSKGNKIELQTSVLYGKLELIGHRVEEKDVKKFVNMICC